MIRGDSGDGCDVKVLVARRHCIAFSPQPFAFSPLLPLLVFLFGSASLIFPLLSPLPTLLLRLSFLAPLDFPLVSCPTIPASTLLRFCAPFQIEVEPVITTTTAATGSSAVTNSPLSVKSYIEGTMWASVSASTSKIEEMTLQYDTFAFFKHIGLADTC
jgi:hypothetical protein